MIEARAMTWPRIGEVPVDEEPIDIEQVLAEARERGFDEGFAAGKTEGEAAGRAVFDSQIKAVLAPLEELQKSFEDYRLTLDAQERSALAQVLKKAFSALVRDALLTDQRVLEDYIQAAVERLGSAENIKIMASMAMADALRSVGSDLAVQVDESLPEYGMKLESASSTWAADPVGDFDDLVDAVFGRGGDESIDC